MSDSDDTDLLLLIPPDFFAVDSSESEDSYLPKRNGSFKHFHFDKLISQVNALEDRVNFIECKDNVTSENLSETSRLNHSIDYSLSYDSSKYRNICGGDLALRFYSLTSHGFSFGNNNSNDIPCIESLELNSCPNAIMPYQTSSANGTSGKCNVNDINTKSSDLRTSNFDSTRAPYSLPTRSSMTIDCVSAPNARSKYSHRLLPNSSYRHFTFLNEIDEYLEGKYKENVNERLLSNMQTVDNNGECIKESVEENSSDNSKFPVVSKKSFLELSEKTNTDFSHVDKLLREVETTHLDVRNKVQPSFPTYGVCKTAEEPSGFKCSSAVPKENIINNCNDKSIAYSKSSDVNSSRLCEEVFEKSNKISCHSEKSNEESKEQSKFLEIESGNSGQCMSRIVNPVDALRKPIVGSKFISPSEEYYDQERRPIVERSHEILNARSEREVSSQLYGQVVEEISDFRKFRVGNDENSVKHCQFMKHTEEQSAPKLSSSSVPGETLSSVHTNSESVSGHTSLHIDGRNKNMRPLIPDDGYFSSLGACSNAGNLLSLSDLWGKEKKPHQAMDVSTMEHRLQEELCRRKHCERVILELQSTVLELQQKLTFAVRVDQSKDNTILQLQSAWKRLASHWQELEEQRNALSIQCSEEKEKYQRDMSEMIQKTKWYENEVSKALTVAQGYKEKNDMLEQKIKSVEKTYADDRKALEDSVAEERKHLSETKVELSNVCREMEEIKKKMEIVEKEAAQDKEMVLKSQEEVKTGKKALEKLTCDLVAIKEENNSLHLSLKEEKAKNEIGNLQIKNLQSTLDESIQKEKLLEKEIKEKVSLVEKTKSDLRNFYQQQVEFVVQEKLVEFQTQLDAAEASLHQEMEQKERLALQTASKQIKLITEKNILEVKLLEEKHKEELNLCKLQLTQAMQQIGHLQLQLQSHSNRKVEIVEKLHTVMENQWQEALRIISGNSPVVQPFPIQNTTVERSNEVYSTPSRDIRNTRSNGDCDNIPLLPVAHSSGSSTTDEEPFNKDDQLTYRPNNEVRSSEAVRLKDENPDLIKKYIQVLLNRPPGNTMTEEAPGHNSETPVCEGRSVPKWEKGMENHRILSANERQNFASAAEDVKCSSSVFKEVKSNKPPWK